jgi:decaprenylphospho-beta-D-erythro-pentofuranosid-2-ulose 2-reductase
VIDALGTPQRILLLGGTSDIGLAIVRELLPSDRKSDVILAGRDQSALEQAGADLAAQARVRTVHFDAADVGSHATSVEDAWADGDVDIVIFAFGVLGDQTALLDDPATAVHITTVNHLGAVSSGLHVARRMREQKHGHIIALSSIAAERARPSNFIYGASKAGFDTFFDGLGYLMTQHGVTVSVIRPGFVRTRMTEGLDVPPLASNATSVAASAVASVGRTGVRYLALSHRVLGTGLRLVPRAIVRRLP